jgi:hypothetical protein
VRPRQLQRRLGAASAALALVLAGCAVTHAEPGADTFYRDHSGEAERAAAATRAAETAALRLSRPPTSEQLEALALYAQRGRRHLIAASEWPAVEGREEENLRQAQTEVNEGATLLIGAMKSLHAYAQARQPQALASYRTQLARGREFWNEGIRELWFLAHRHAPPTI